VVNSEEYMGEIFVFLNINKTTTPLLFFSSRGEERLFYIDGTRAEALMPF
jgi:hypothetical protein